MFSDVRECFAQLNPFLCGKGRMGKTSNEGIVMVLPWNWLRTGASRVPCFLLFESLLTYLGIHQEETTNLPANVLGQQRSLPNLRNLELYSHANFTEQSRIPITQYGPFTAPVKQVCFPQLKPFQCGQGWMGQASSQTLVQETVHPQRTKLLTL